MKPETVTREFRKYLVRSRLHGTYLAVNLHRILLDWMALPTIHELYMEELSVPERVALLEAIESKIRASWTEKAKRTRAQNKKQKEKRTNAERQLRFKF